VMVRGLINRERLTSSFSQVYHETGASIYRKTRRRIPSCLCVNTYKSPKAPSVEGPKAPRRLTRGMGERRKLPQRGSGQNPGCQRFLCILNTNLNILDQSYN
jgi:hypothetical protein